LKNDESILVISSFILATILFILIIWKGPRLGILNKNVYFDKSRLRSYFVFLAMIAISSLPIGYIITRNSFLVLQYIGFNVFIGSVMGANLILFRHRKK